jgi:hypothetical protein
MSSEQKNCEGVERLESSAIRQSAPLEPLVRKRGLHESSSDLAYWLSQSPQARIAALEEIRQEYELWRYGAQTNR